jgi:hypothetical protein
LNHWCSHPKVSKIAKANHIVINKRLLSIYYEAFAKAGVLELRVCHTNFGSLLSSKIQKERIVIDKIIMMRIIVAKRQVLEVICLNIDQGFIVLKEVFKTAVVDSQYGWIKES